MLVATTVLGLSTVLCGLTTSMYVASTSVCSPLLTLSSGVGLDWQEAVDRLSSFGRKLRRRDGSRRSVFLDSELKIERIRRPDFPIYQP